MRRIVMALTLALAFTTAGFAQDDEEATGPNFDELIAFLSLSDSQVECLEANQDALREAASPSFEELRSLQRDLREARRNEEDTSAIEAEIESVRANIAAIRSTFVVSAQGCLTTDQVTLLGELIAAETLMNEVRQGKRLSLFEGTEERADGPGTGRAGSRRGGRGQRGGIGAFAQ